MATSLDYEMHKKVTLQIVEEHHNMKPVIEDLEHDGLSAIQGKWVYWVECQDCGKRYKWNQLVWQARHKRECQLKLRLNCLGKK